VNRRLPFQNPDQNLSAGPVGKDLPEVFDRMRGRPEDGVSYAVTLNDGETLSRLRAAEALGEIGDPAGLPPLIDALRDESTVVRYAAAKSLGAHSQIPVLPAPSWPSPPPRTTGSAGLRPVHWVLSVRRGPLELLPGCSPILITMSGHVRSGRSARWEARRSWRRYVRSLPIRVAMSVGRRGSREPVRRGLFGRNRKADARW
jgi:hypothetical protein